MKCKIEIIQQMVYYVVSLCNITDRHLHSAEEIGLNVFFFFFRNGIDAFPPLTAVETSWNGSLGSLCFQDYMEAEQMESKQSPSGNVLKYPREETEKAVVQFIGKLFL